MLDLLHKGFLFNCFVLFLLHSRKTTCIFQCLNRVFEFEQKLTHLGSQLAVMEGRQGAIWEEVKHEITEQSTVTNFLVGDNVKIEGKLRALQGNFALPNKYEIRI